MENVNQKGTALTGAALSDEVMESSDSVLAAGAYGVGQKGLQQFYSPPEAARLAHAIIGDEVAVLDPTAGDGSLLKEFNPTLSYGVEIDKDQIKNSEGGYNALRGDFQHIYTLLRLGISPWGAIVANPPFGLTWEEPTIRNGKPTNSTVLTFIMLNRLLAEDGQFMFICGAGRHERQIAQLDEYSTVYAVIECDDLFEGTREPCAILFGLHDNLRSVTDTGVLGTRKVPRDMLDLTAAWVLELRSKALDTYGRISRGTYSNYQRIEQFKTLQPEYDRRVEKRIKTREFDAQLYNGDHIQWLPSAFAKQALTQAGLAYEFNGLNGQPVAYFAQNERLWFKLGSAEERGLVTVDPRLREAVAKVIGDIEKHRVPLYAVKPQQRLGFLDDVDALICTKDDPERRFRAGEVYRLDTDTVTQVTKETRIVESKKNPGEYLERDFETHRKVMRITLSGNGAHYVITDGGDNATQDISWLIDHFDVPDPGEIATRHPEQIAALEELVDQVFEDFLKNSQEWEKTNPVSKPFSKRDFQKADIARLLFKEFAALTWEQGLGKTAGALAFASGAWKLRAKKKLLIVTPGDLKDQWTRECERFLGITPTVITTHGQAKKIAHDLRMGGEGVYIVHYEAMAINGTRGKNKALPVVTVKEWPEKRVRKGTDRWTYWVWYRESDDSEIQPNNVDAVTALGIEGYGSGEKYAKFRDQMLAVGYDIKPCRSWASPNGTRCEYSYVPPIYETITKKLTSKDICPECHADVRNGWNGLFCEAEKEDGSTCGYAHFAVRMKPIASLLSTAFHDGVVVLDEITYIQGRDSKRSKAMRGIQGRYRLGLSGTPIKNYIHQIFWPLAWCLGYSKPWFPYDYAGGHTRFENDFCVIEFQTNGRRKEVRKVLPDVTNLSRFWRLLASHNIRRRQEETGEDLVDIFYHEVKVPLGIRQAEQTAEWLKKLPHGFPAFFAEKYPDSKVVKAGMHEIMAPMLGLNWKLDYACVLPEDDPEGEWTGIDVSNWTPANLRTLELTMALVKEGRKVLVGSHLVGTGKWLAEQLTAKGVNAVHIVDENGQTTAAKKRGQKVYSFQTNPDVQVFCAGMKAIRLGHNLDAADAVVINGLDFDYETLDQFVKRVRRLTSVNDVDVFVMLPQLNHTFDHTKKQDTITSRKWAILNLKGNAADLALDGRLVLKNEQEISEAEMVRELQERGLTVTDDAVDEVSVYEAWEATPMLEDFDHDGIIPPRPEKAKDPKPGEQLDIEAIVEAEPAPEAVPDEAVLEQNQVEFDAIDAAEAELQELEASATSDFDSFPVEMEAELPTNAELDALVEEAFTEPEGTPSADPDTATEPLDSDAMAVVSETSHGAAVPVEPETTEPGPSAQDAPPAPSLDYMGQLKQAAELHNLGILSADEFATLKADLLAGIRKAAA